MDERWKHCRYITKGYSGEYRCIGTREIDLCQEYNCKHFCWEKPKIITLCGSTRFKTAFEYVARALTLQGYIVLMPGVWGHIDGGVSPEQKERLDNLHFAKIAMSDEVFIVDIDGYVGASTKNEIEYARTLGKPIRYNSDENIVFDF